MAPKNFENKMSAIGWFLSTGKHTLINKRVIENEEEEQLFLFNKEAYMVLTEDEAKYVAKAKIIKSLHKEETDKILKYVDMENEKGYYGIMSSIQSFGSSANLIIKKLLGEKYDDFVNDLIDNCDTGRGLYIADFDGLEFRIGQFYIYRLR